MPPKKKGTTTPKVSKQESLKDPLPESSSEPKKIPKKPFFRNVNYDSLNRVRHMRIKLWKIRSCSFLGYTDEDLDNELDSDSDDYSYERRYEERFHNTLKTSTMKKSLQNTKRITCGSSLFAKSLLIRKLFSNWRLDYLSISVFNENLKNYNALKPLLNSSLKKCCLQFYSDEEIIDPKLVAIFRVARKSKLFIISHSDSLYIQMNPAKLLPCGKLKLPSRFDDSGCENFSSKVMINAPESFQKISFKCRDAPTRGQRVKIELPELPNLEKLHFVWDNQYRDERIDDISFVKQYHKLQSLGISLDNRETETLDYIGELTELKDFLFFSNQCHLRKGPMRSLPNLTQLERFDLHLDTPIFTMKDVRDFISKNKNLKELGLGLTIQNAGAIFEEDIALPEIEKLRLNFIQLERPYAGGAKRIAQILKTQDSIKELIIRVSQSYADLNAVLLKDGVAKMKSLEKLTLQFRMSGGLEENKYKHLKDVFVNNPGIAELDLDVSCDAIATRELGTILDGLMKLKNLKKFSLKAKLAKMTPAAFNKLSGFIVSLRHLKAFKLDITGLSEEDGYMLREKMLPKHPLSNTSLSFHSPLPAFYHMASIDTNEDDLDHDLD